MGLRPLEIVLFFQCGDRLYTSESAVYRRQILTYKDGPRAERVNAQIISLKTTLDYAKILIIMVYIFLFAELFSKYTMWRDVISW